MGNKIFLCQKCRNIFLQPMQPGSDVPCPQCGSIDLEEAPAWAPLGSGSNIFEDTEWEYQCQQCLNKFKMPIPKSPTEEKNRVCPGCGANHIHRLTEIKGEPLYCG